MGNILDSAFYGLIFSESTPYTVAQFGGHYAGLHDGQGGGHVLFPAVPVERRAAPAALSGRQQQLLLRRDLQSGRRLHLRGSRLSASVSVQILQQVDFFRKKSWRFRKKYYFCTPQFQKCPGGGIGRRARFRCVCRKACRFDSCPGHQRTLIISVLFFV